MHLIRIGKTQIFLFAVFSLAYASLAPNIFQQDWDSLMYSYWSEVDGIRSIWGNHPLGHVILNSLYVMTSNLGYYGKALPIFIIINSLFGGAAVALSYSLMKTIKMDYWFSLGYAIIFGAGYGLWHYSGSADIYSLSVLLLLSAWFFLIHEVLLRNDRHLYITGVIAGLSVLSHQLNAVFFLAALIIILSQKTDRWARIVTFYAASSLIVLAGTILFGWVATSSFSVSAIYDWFRGYLGDPIYGTSLTIESIQLSLKTAWGTILVPTLGRARFIRMAVYSFLIGAVLLGATQIKQLDREKKAVLLSAFLQCLVSWLLIVWFEPWYPKFWLLVLVPAMIVLACCIHASERMFSLWLGDLSSYRKYYSSVLIIIGLTVAVYNVKYAILGEHKSDAISQKSMSTWLEHTSPSDMLITAGDLIPQLWFWSNRPNTIHLYHYLVVNKDSDDRFEYLRDQIDQFLCDGNMVMFAPAIMDNFGESFLLWLNLSRNDLRLFFDEYQKKEYFTYRNLDNGEETQVYKLINPNACSY